MNETSKRVKSLLEKRSVSKELFLFAEASIESPLVYFELYDFDGITHNLLKGVCNEEMVSNYKLILDGIKQDMSNIQKNEAFPPILISATIAVLSLYDKYPDICIADDMEDFLPTAIWLLSENKIACLKHLEYNYAVRALEVLLKMAILRNENTTVNRLTIDYLTFEDANTVGVDVALTLIELEKLLDAKGILDNVICPSPETTIKSFIGEVYMELI